MKIRNFLQIKKLSTNENRHLVEDETEVKVEQEIDEVVQQALDLENPKSYNKYLAEEVEEIVEMLNKAIEKLRGKVKKEKDKEAKGLFEEKLRELVNTLFAWQERIDQSDRDHDNKMNQEVQMKNGEHAIPGGQPGIPVKTPGQAVAAEAPEGAVPPTPPAKNEKSDLVSKYLEEEEKVEDKEEEKENLDDDPNPIGPTQLPDVVDPEVEAKQKREERQKDKDKLENDKFKGKTDVNSKHVRLV